ncbi:RagB/SusD family nutrient uptake outer membrane protein [Ancylomarina sp. 16SWW S1-10-2]|uniref:RagB/SusD family nutrient uptake outer membrane protein n=1 Tax=Ancylomarina sp. 16SWW S1-10-2 TaxID=2499681 RepID=UPI0012AEAA5F|nr:RagB/SusD family nutrient uptake outer membrane protein [Ancylomarina sp. 16SWW S1-10-2]MRT93193.1 RagB/SusD family nutrient uptake outer membrane protein [Ancylomarina sp. 16SWW S1-10-2]
MKIVNKILYTSSLLSLLIGFNSCESYLEEENPSEITSESYITESTADELVVGVYEAEREVYKDYESMFFGTDIFTSQNALYNYNALNEYYNLNSSSDGIEDIWDNNYSVISKANTVINRYENEINWSESNLESKASGIAQAKGLRGLAYYNLVQQFGGVVLTLDEINSIDFSYTRSTEEEVFTQIIKDLEDAIPDLESNPDFGRFSKRAAQHVLADVYVTRGYKSFGNSTDFTTAAALAVSAIDSYDIRSQSYAEVFDYGNQENDEILFSIQYSSGGESDDHDNDKQGLFMNQVFNYVGIERTTSTYGESLTGKEIMPTDFFYALFDDNDTRDDATFFRVLFATEETSYTSDNGIDPISIGDTIIYYPKNSLETADLNDKLNRYYVYQPGQYTYDAVTENVDGAIYQYTNNFEKTNFPIFKKFNDVNSLGTDGGERDTYVFRVAETYLIAAEAYLEAGNISEALKYINLVRERATGVANYYTSLDIDDILNERALELAGESNRWNILKRTGKLEERINLYNPHVINHGTFDDATHLVRPIPADEMELSNGSLVQNTGY